jgi:hypothetical protein
MPIQRTTRFGVFPALKLGHVFIVLFPSWHVGFYRPRAVETKNGVSDLTAINLGRVLLMGESRLEKP